MMFKSDREYLRRYGKFLVAAQEKYSDGGHIRPYTPFRYVSQKEINKMVKAWPNSIEVLSWESFKGRKQPKLVVIKIVRTNTFNGISGEIVERPGYYRVEANKKPLPFFKTACAYGIPINMGIGRLSHWEETFNAEWRKRHINWQLEKLRRDVRAKRMEDRRRLLTKIPEKRESQQFFQAVAMAGAVGG